MACLFYHPDPIHVHRATSHLIKCQIWIRFLVWLHFCAQSGHTEPCSRRCLCQTAGHCRGKTTIRVTFNFFIYLFISVGKRQWNFCFSKAGANQTMKYPNKTECRAWACLFSFSTFNYELKQCFPLRYMK